MGRGLGFPTGGNIVKRALIVWGGYEPHEPEKGAHVVRGMLEAEGFEVVVSPDYSR